MINDKNCHLSYCCKFTNISKKRISIKVVHVCAQLYLQQNQILNTINKSIGIKNMKFTAISEIKEDLIEIKDILKKMQADIKLLENKCIHFENN
jgi:hypothetical protein